MWLRNQKSKVLLVWHSFGSILLLAGSRWENMSVSFMFHKNIWAFTLARPPCCFWLFSGTHRADWLSLLRWGFFRLLAVINSAAKGSQGGLGLEHSCGFAAKVSRVQGDAWRGQAHIKVMRSKLKILKAASRCWWNCLTFKRSHIKSHFQNFGFDSGLWTGQQLSEGRKK